MSINLKLINHKTYDTLLNDINSDKYSGGIRCTTYSELCRESVIAMNSPEYARKKISGTIQDSIIVD